MIKAIPVGVLRMIRDRALYERAVALSIFEKGRGHLEEKLADGSWQVTDWRTRPEVIALSDAPEVLAAIAEMSQKWIKDINQMKGMAEIESATRPLSDTQPLSDAK